jgi:hypothetical protein
MNLKTLTWFLFLLLNLIGEAHVKQDKIQIFTDYSY